MTAPGSHPHLWHSLVHLLGLLRGLLLATDPAAFAAISGGARARLAHLAAMVRRYIHILAAELTLPQLRPTPPCRSPALQDAGPRQRTDTFALHENPSVSGLSYQPGSDGDPPALQWALVWEAARRLSGVMADPARHALRLARALQVRATSRLRSLPVRWSVLRRLGPAADVLLTRLDQLARPAAWAGIDTS